MNTVAVELFFMMIVLKLPVVYLCGVVWWAVRAEPQPLDGAVRTRETPSPPCPWDRSRSRPRGTHRGGPPARGSAARRAGVRA